VPGDHRVATSRDAQPERLCGPACSNVTDDSYTRTRVSEAKLGAERPTGGSIALWIFGHEAAERADSAENVRSLMVTVNPRPRIASAGSGERGSCQGDRPTVSSAAAGARRSSCRGGCISQRGRSPRALAGRRSQGQASRGPVSPGTATVADNERSLRAVGAQVGHSETCSVICTAARLPPLDPCPRSSSTSASAAAPARRSGRRSGPLPSCRARSARGSDRPCGSSPVARREKRWSGRQRQADQPLVTWVFPELGGVALPGRESAPEGVRKDV
jgi:hypothetical protein